MTYSLIGFDPETGAIGAASQSCWFNVGPKLIWIEPGVGAVLTQAFLEPSYGSLGIAFLREGRSAAETIATLTSADREQALRQVAMLDTRGHVATHTGSRCVQYAGSASSEHCVAVGNMLAADCWTPMVEAFEGNVGQPLPERLLACLRAAEDAGGDARGSQSGAIRVRTPEGTGETDLRVVDHADPVGELGRILTLKRAYDRLDEGIDLGLENRHDEGLAAIAEARALAPEKDQLVFWQAVGLARAGRVDDAGRALAEATAANPHWPSYLEAAAAAGLLPEDPGLTALMRGALRAD